MNVVGLEDLSVSLHNFNNSFNKLSIVSKLSCLLFASRQCCTKEGKTIPVSLVWSPLIYSSTSKCCNNRLTNPRDILPLLALLPEREGERQREREGERYRGRESER